MLRILILSLSLCSLLHLQVTGFGMIPKAYAEEVVIDTGSATASANQAELRQIADKARAADTYDNKRTTGEVSLAVGRGFLEGLTVLVISVVGLSLLVSCHGGRSLVEMLAFAAGAGAFFYGEVQALLKYKKIEHIVEEFSFAKDNKKQVDALTTQRGLYEELKSTAQTKHTLQQSAAVAFTFASAIALYRHFAIKSELVTTEITHKSTLTSCMAPSIMSTACAAPMGEAMAALSAKIASFKATDYSSKMSTGDSLPTYSTTVPKLKKDQVTYESMCLSSRPCCPQGNTTGYMYQVVEEKYVKNLVACKNWDEAFDKSAFAKLGLGLKTTAFFKGMIRPVSKFMDKFMFYPLRRSAVMATCAALAEGAALLTKENIKNIDDHIAMIDKILAKFDPSTATISAVNVIADSRIEATDSANRKQISSKFPCVMVGTTRSGCGSMGQAYNQALGDMTKTTGINLNGFGAGVAGLGTSTANLADQLQGTTTLGSDALATASSLASKGAIAKKFKEDVLKAFEKSDKDSANEFKKMNNEFLQGIAGVTKSALQASGLNGATALAALGMMDPLTKKEEKKKGTIDAKAISSIMSGSAPVNSAQEVPNFSGDFAPVETPAAAVEAAAASNEVLDDTKAGDINADPERPIFEIITQRYFRSGLDKLGIQKAEVSVPLAPSATPNR